MGLDAYPRNTSEQIYVKAKGESALYPRPAGHSPNYIITRITGHFYEYRVVNEQERRKANVPELVRRRNQSRKTRSRRG